jgi:hypothetical protein
LFHYLINIIRFFLRCYHNCTKKIQMYPNESPKKALAKIGDKEISAVVVSGQKSEYKY